MSFELKLLGGASLLRDGVPVTGREVQRRRLALLALLALPRGQPLSRDSLIGFLWPERDAAAGRHLLSASLHVLRRSLGEAALLAGRDDVRLDTGIVGSDVGRFEDALEGGDVQCAVSLYHGPFLSGFFLPSAPEFERWVEEERARLAGAFGKALETLAEQVGSGSGSAVELWTRLSVHAPYDSRIALRLMTELAAAGNRAGALQHARAHADRLRAELDVAPDPAIGALALRLRGEPAEAPPGPADSTTRLALPGVSAPAFPPLPPSAPVPVPGDAVRRRVSWRLTLIGLALASIAGLVGVTWQGWPRRAGAALDPETLAVLPFRTAGAGPGMAYLSDGMVDLLSASLTGSDGPSSVDPRAILSAWRRAAPEPPEEAGPDAALRVAESLGAGRMILGEIGGTPSRLVLSASLLRVPSGRIQARATAAGPLDSLAWLADGLAASLLSREAGEEERRLPALVSTSLPALRAYLRGRAAYRDGRYREAGAEYYAALELDSTFAQPAFGIVQTNLWSAVLANEQRERARRLAHAYRDRLTERDRAFLSAVFGPRSPGVSSIGEHFSAWEHALELAPDRPETWLQVGDQFFHFGALLGRREPGVRAEFAFRRALELDPSFAPPLEHLFLIALARGDTAGVQSTGRLYLERHPAGETAPAVRWWLAYVLGDSAEVRALRSSFDRLPDPALRRIHDWGFYVGAAMPDVERASAGLLARTPSGRPRRGVLFDRRQLFLNLGRPHAAEQATGEMREVEDLRVLNVFRIEEALYAGGDSEAAAAAVLQLAPAADAPLSPERSKRAEQLEDLCRVEQWRLWHGEGNGAARAVTRLESADLARDDAWTVATAEVCARALEAIRATLGGGDDADGRIARLDSISLAWAAIYPYANFIVGRLKDMRGDRPGALAAFRRRMDFAADGILNLAGHLREEGRLAALTGDREGAVRAYRHYLALRYLPEPSLAAEAAGVRTELERLAGAIHR